jgi:hypothetical protein
MEYQVPVGRLEILSNKRTRKLSRVAGVWLAPIAAISAKLRVARVMAQQNKSRLMRRRPGIPRGD